MCNKLTKAESHCPKADGCLNSGIFQDSFPLFSHLHDFFLPTIIHLLSCRFLILLDGQVDFLKTPSVAERIMSDKRST